jgi:hypothetical protein
MGLLHDYVCDGCGHRFTATTDLDSGWSGDVVTPVVCSEHGIGSADVGINLAMREKITSEIQDRPRFPCPTCGVESLRWDRKSCPQCGAERLNSWRMMCWD